MSEPYRIVVVEDDPQMRRFLKTGLEAHGYGVAEAVSGQEGLKQITGRKAHVILLDLSLPDMDGMEVLGEVRSWSQTPVIVLSSRNAAGDKIDALDKGANDYVTKPFDMGELLARIRAALRQKVVEAGVEPSFRSGPLEVDLVRREVRLRGQDLHLSPKEYDLLRALVSQAGMVLTHQMLLREVWGPAHLNETNYVRIFIGRLRHKIEDDPARPRLIVSEPGVGYRIKVLPPEE